MGVRDSRRAGLSRRRDYPVNSVVGSSGIFLEARGYSDLLPTGAELYDTGSKERRRRSREGTSKEEY